MPFAETVPQFLIGACFVVLPMLFTLPKPARLLLNSRFGAIAALAAGCAGVIGYIKYESMAISFREFLVICMPALQIAIGATSYHLFIWLRGKPPGDVLFNSVPGLFWDRLFSISVASICVLLPMFLIGRENGI